MKYATASLSFFDNEVKVQIVEANSPEEAIILGLIEQSRIDSKDGEGDLNVIKWANSFKGKSIDDIKENLGDGDIAVATPVLLD